MASEWPALAAAAKRMLAQREASAEANIEKGKLTPEQAADRIRVARALSRLWDTIAAGTAPYDFETAWIESAGREGTYPHELRTDLDAAATRARTLADRKGDAQAAAFADALAALAWHARPRDHISNIIDVAHANAAARSGRAP